MKIKDLPKPIKRLAKRNVEKQRGWDVRFYHFVNGWNIELNKAFVWKLTIEDYEYWYQVDNGNFIYEPRKEGKVQYNTKKIFEAIRNNVKSLKIKVNK